MAAQIRLIRESDVEAFRAVLDAVAAEKRWLAMVSAPSLESVRAFVRDNIRAHHAQYVALEDGVVVGWVDVCPGERDATRHMGRLGMGILAGYRGRGIGGELLDAAIAHCWQSGLLRIELEVLVDNERAIALYEGRGFQHEGRLRKARRIDGTYRDVFHMALLHPSIGDADDE